MVERTKLLWFGRPPSVQDITEAKNRNLTIDQVGASETPDCTYARGAIFWATSPHFQATAEALEANVRTAIDHGLYVHIVVGDEAQRRDIAAALDSALPNGLGTDRYRLRIEPVPPHEGPNAVLTHNPGPPANDKLQITLEDGVLLTEEQCLLLQRAFHDCRSIELRKIPGGLSKAKTFLVDARLQLSTAGPRPTPFFVKLDGPAKLRQEMERFRTFAEHHIEWHLRPNFIDKRSIYGVGQAILVGAFVGASRSLWEVVVGGDGPRHIRSLFEDTLVGLRQEAEQSHLEVDGSVVEPLEHFCRHQHIPADRIEAASRLFGGAVYPARTLWRKLLNLPNQPWRRSAMHGDMHGENVRVRKGNAIVIDFAHACAGPMSADVASLEVWIAFKVSDAKVPTQAEWRRRTDALFAPDAVDRSLSDLAPELEGDAVAACVYELRRVARKSAHSEDEYKRVLSIYLLRHAAFPPDEACIVEDEFRRTYAYWLANRLVQSLCAAHESQLEAA